MSRVCIYYSRVSLRFPRVSGDEPKRELAILAAQEFSPRERG